MSTYATALYCGRNIGKVHNGDTGRAGAAMAQTTNLINAASQSSVAPIQKGAAMILHGVDDAGKYIGVADAASKVTNFASKAVNPLLCVGAGVRVIKDDDKYAALIEESAAMGAMFASEKLFKKLISCPVAGQEVKSTAKWITNIASKITDATKGLTGGKRKLAVIAADLALVGVSILSYDIGKKIAKNFSNREEEPIYNIQSLDYES